MTDAEKVCAALREPTLFPGHLSPRVRERCAALADFVEAAQALRLYELTEDIDGLDLLDRYDAALTRLAEVLG